MILYQNIKHVLLLTLVLTVKYISRPACLINYYIKLRILTFWKPSHGCSNGLEWYLRININTAKCFCGLLMKNSLSMVRSQNWHSKGLLKCIKESEANSVKWVLLELTKQYFKLTTDYGYVYLNDYCKHCFEIKLKI